MRKQGIARNSKEIERCLLLNLDVILAFVFYGLLLVFFFTHRRKFELQGILALYRTKLGLKLMEKFSSFSPRFTKVLGVVGIILGYGGMGVMIYFLILGVVWVISGGPPLLSPVLPGIQIAPGLPRLGFWHWILSIFIVAAVHEFAHGVYARLYKVKVKSSGFAFLGPILAAFVEPDEKQLEKIPRKAQLSMFAAGPFSNMILGGIFSLLTIFLIAPVAFGTIDQSVFIHDFGENSALEAAGVGIGEQILEVNGVPLESLEREPKLSEYFRMPLSTFLQLQTVTKVSGALEGVGPGDSVVIVTNKQSYTIQTGIHPLDEQRPYLGVSFTSPGYKQEYLSRYGEFWLNALFWVYLLFWWVYNISFGIGIFNLVPLGPIDGGRMLLTGLTTFMKPETAKKVWSKVSTFVILLIVINLLPWLFKLFSFITGFV